MKRGCLLSFSSFFPLSDVSFRASPGSGQEDEFGGRYTGCLTRWSIFLSDIFYHWFFRLLTQPGRSVEQGFVSSTASLLISDVVDVLSPVLSPVPIFLSQLFINKAQTLVHCYGQPQLPTLHFP